MVAIEWAENCLLSSTGKNEVMRSLKKYIEIQQSDTFYEFADEFLSDPLDENGTGDVCRLAEPSWDEPPNPVGRCVEGVDIKANTREEVYFEGILLGRTHFKRKLVLTLKQR